MSEGGIGDSLEEGMNPYESEAYRDFGAVLATDLQDQFAHSYRTRANQLKLPPELPWELPKPNRGEDMVVYQK